MGDLAERFQQLQLVIFNKYTRRDTAEAASWSRAGVKGQFRLPARRTRPSMMLRRTQRLVSDVHRWAKGEKEGKRGEIL